MATPSLMLYKFCKSHCRPFWVRMSYEWCLYILPWAPGTLCHLLDAFDVLCAVLSDTYFPLHLALLKFLHTGQMFIYSPNFPKTLFRVLLILKSRLNDIIEILPPERKSNFFTEIHDMLVFLSNLPQLLYYCIATATIQFL